MKKLCLSLCAIIFALCANAQIMRVEELETYAKEKYGDKWVDAATNLANSLSLDKNNSLTYTQVVNCPGKTKDQLYVILNYWFTASFNDANSVIQLNDKEAGCIIGQGYMQGIAHHTGGLSAYNVDIKPVIKVDIKDEKVRITYTIQAYTVSKIAGGGFMGGLSKTGPIEVHETWTLENCFPFAEKDKHKKTSCKALIMAHAYSNVLMDKIEEAVKNGLSGNESEDW